MLRSAHALGRTLTNFHPGQTDKSLGDALLSAPGLPLQYVDKQHVATYY
jgi:hypothetical protein